ncbi:Protein dopey-1 [Porphyridium purpureum]|uniref:Protein dopey-1 n=1 Tax=Porphyridium purpureum TaxID=35688 RepID=A0A5J4Z2X0_PORPP|nr:Protein dopey-1 [Porphyridium purpureum]|eukprot:POR4082..scf295_1
MESSEEERVLERGGRVRGGKYALLRSELLNALHAFDRAQDWADLIHDLQRVNRILLKHASAAPAPAASSSSVEAADETSQNQAGNVTAAASNHAENGTSAAQYGYIPEKNLLAKRLAQCLTPSLPSGVHLKALETYHLVFGRIGPRRLAKDLPKYCAGLFPLLSYGAMPLKRPLIALYEQYLLPLGAQPLRGVASGFIQALLPALEDTDESSECFLAASDLLAQFRDVLSDDALFTESLWHVILTAPGSLRLTACNYLRSLVEANTYHASLSSAAATPNGQVRKNALVSNPELVAAALSVALGEDQGALTQRAALDLLLTCSELNIGSTSLFGPGRGPESTDTAVLTSKAGEEAARARLDGTCTTRKIRLLKSVLLVLIRRELNLSKRVYSYLVGNSTDSTQRQSYFEENARAGCLAVIDEMWSKLQLAQELSTSNDDHQQGDMGAFDATAASEHQMISGANSLSSNGTHQQQGAYAKLKRHILSAYRVLLGLLDREEIFTSLRPTIGMRLMQLSSPLIGAFSRVREPNVKMDEYTSRQAQNYGLASVHQPLSIEQAQKLVALIERSNAEVIGCIGNDAFYADLCKYMLHTQTLAESQSSFFSVVLLALQTLPLNSREAQLDWIPSLLATCAGFYERVLMRDDGSADSQEGIDLTRALDTHTDVALHGWMQVTILLLSALSRAENKRCTTLFMRSAVQIATVFWIWLYMRVRVERVCSDMRPLNQASESFEAESHSHQTQDQTIADAGVGRGASDDLGLSGQASDLQVSVALAGTSIISGLLLRATASLGTVKDASALDDSSFALMTLVRLVLICANRCVVSSSLGIVFAGLRTLIDVSRYVPRERREKVKKEPLSELFALMDGSAPALQKHSVSDAFCIRMGKLIGMRSGFELDQSENILYLSGDASRVDMDQRVMQRLGLLIAFDASEAPESIEMGLIRPCICRAWRLLHPSRASANAACAELWLGLERSFTDAAHALVADGILADASSGKRLFSVDSANAKPALASARLQNLQCLASLWDLSIEHHLLMSVATSDALLCLFLDAASSGSGSSNGLQICNKENLSVCAFVQTWLARMMRFAPGTLLDPLFRLLLLPARVYSEQPELTSAFASESFDVARSQYAIQRIRDLVSLHAVGAATGPPANAALFGTADGFGQAAAGSLSPILSQSSNMNGMNASPLTTTGRGGGDRMDGLMELLFEPTSTMESLLRAKCSVEVSMSLSALYDNFKKSSTRSSGAGGAQSHIHEDLRVQELKLRKLALTNFVEDGDGGGTYLHAILIVAFECIGHYVLIQLAVMAQTSVAQSADEKERDDPSDIMLRPSKSKLRALAIMAAELLAKLFSAASSSLVSSWSSSVASAQQVRAHIAQAFLQNLFYSIALDDKMLQKHLLDALESFFWVSSLARAHERGPSAAGDDGESHASQVGSTGGGHLTPELPPQSQASDSFAATLAPCVWHGLRNACVFRHDADGAYGDAFVSRWTQFCLLTIRMCSWNHGVGVGFSDVFDVTFLPQLVFGSLHILGGELMESVERPVQGSTCSNLTILRSVRQVIIGAMSTNATLSSLSGRLSLQAENGATLLTHQDKSASSAAAGQPNYSGSAGRSAFEYIEGLMRDTFISSSSSGHSDRLLGQMTGAISKQIARDVHCTVFALMPRLVECFAHAWIPARVASVSSMYDAFFWMLDEHGNQNVQHPQLRDHRQRLQQVAPRAQLAAQGHRGRAFILSTLNSFGVLYPSDLMFVLVHVWWRVHARFLTLPLGIMNGCISVDEAQSARARMIKYQTIQEYVLDIVLKCGRFPGSPVLASGSVGAAVIAHPLHALAMIVHVCMSVNEGAQEVREASKWMRTLSKSCLDGFMSLFQNVENSPRSPARRRKGDHGSEFMRASELNLNGALGFLPRMQTFAEEPGTATGSGGRFNPGAGSASMSQPTSSVIQAAATAKYAYLSAAGSVPAADDLAFMDLAIGTCQAANALIGTLSLLTQVIDFCASSSTASSNESLFQQQISSAVPVLLTCCRAVISESTNAGAQICTVRLLSSIVRCSGSAADGSDRRMKKEIAALATQALASCSSLIAGNMTISSTDLENAAQSIRALRTPSESGEAHETPDRQQLTLHFGVMALAVARAHAVELLDVAQQEDRVSAISMLQSLLSVCASRIKTGTRGLLSAVEPSSVSVCVSAVAYAMDLITILSRKDWSAKLARREVFGLLEDTALLVALSKHRALQTHVGRLISQVVAVERASLSVIAASMPNGLGSSATSGGGSSSSTNSSTRDQSQASGERSMIVAGGRSGTATTVSLGAVSSAIGSSIGKALMLGSSDLDLSAVVKTVCRMVYVLYFAGNQHGSRGFDEQTPFVLERLRDLFRIGHARITQAALLCARVLLIRSSSVAFSPIKASIVSELFRILEAPQRSYIESIAALRFLRLARALCSHDFNYELCFFLIDKAPGSTSVASDPGSPADNAQGIMPLVTRIALGPELGEDAARAPWVRAFELGGSDAASSGTGPEPERAKGQDHSAGEEDAVAMYTLAGMLQRLHEDPYMSARVRESDFESEILFEMTALNRWSLERT